MDKGDRKNLLGQNGFRLKRKKHLGEGLSDLLAYVPEILTQVTLTR